MRETSGVSVGAGTSVSMARGQSAHGGKQESMDLKLPKPDKAARGKF